MYVCKITPACLLSTVFLNVVDSEIWHMTIWISLILYYTTPGERMYEMSRR